MTALLAVAEAFRVKYCYSYCSYIDRLKHAMPLWFLRIYYKICNEDDIVDIMNVRSRHQCVETFSEMPLQHCSTVLIRRENYFRSFDLQFKIRGSADGSCSSVASLSVEANVPTDDDLVCDANAFCKMDTVEKPSMPCGIVPGKGNPARHSVVSDLHFPETEIHKHKLKEHADLCSMETIDKFSNPYGVVLGKSYPITDSIIYGLGIQTDRHENKVKDEFVAALLKNRKREQVKSFMEIKFSGYELDNERRNTLNSLTQMFIQAIVEETGSNIHEIPGTQEQAGTDKWFQVRAYRITASNCHKLATVKTDFGLYCILANTVWNKKHTSRGIRYGRGYEKKGLEAYEHHLLTTTKLKVKNCGFWVNPEYPEMGCTPDGLIYDGDKLIGVVEVKCPLLLEKCHPCAVHTVHSEETLKKYSSEMVNGNLLLKKTHKHFYQVQMQMAICDVEWCDFVLWSPYGMHIERIHRDRAFWKRVSRTLSDIYRSVVVPEIFEMRVPRKMLPFKL